MAENVAPSRATVLIYGESGTGKELLARFIHERSTRRARRMVAVNCAAVPDGLLESELFGYERGAFTGAQGAKPGKFELAHESTFLLDEVSEMPLLLQAKLLRVVQEGEVERLGATAPTKVSVRLVATTNRDLAQMVRAGQFREDLYYRLNVIPLRVPPLRSRPRDIERLARAFAEASAAANGKPSKKISDGAMDKLMRWSWPGNVRELENVIERATLTSEGAMILAEEICVSGPHERGESAFSGHELRAGMTIDEAERRLILKTLEHTRQNRAQAARLLGISIRTLRNKLHEYRVDPGGAPQAAIEAALPITRDERSEALG
jgi:transcriptional regulator with GAF, ATPase, and Fis domain